VYEEPRVFDNSETSDFRPPPPFASVQKPLGQRPGVALIDSRRRRAYVLARNGVETGRPAYKAAFDVARR